jgi:hypothetical protein
LSGVRERRATAAIATAAAIGLTVTLAQLPADASVRSGWRVTNVIGPVKGVTYGAAGLLPAQAQAGASAGWRLSQVIGAPSGETDPATSNPGDSDIAAGGPRSAWSLWHTCKMPCSTVVTYLAHSNGRRWSRVPASEIAGLNAGAPAAVAASSATDAWVLGGARIGRHEPAWHWNGSSWRTLQVPTWVVRGNLAGGADVQTADFNSRDLWVFSLGDMSFKPERAFAARYERGRWRKSFLPAVPAAVSAVSADDIWALGFADPAGHQALLMHWDGRSWNTRRIPKQHLPAKTTGFFQAFAAAGPKDVWLSWQTITGLQGAVTKYLLRWTVRGWSKVHLPAGDSIYGLMSADGRGGLWAAGNGPKPGYPARFFHWVGGRWTTYRVPVGAKVQNGGPQDLVRIPGTRTMLAIGHGYVPYKGNSDNIGLIWVYRP